MLIGLTLTLSAGATVAMAANWLVPEPCEASRRIATRVTLGAVSLSNSSHLAAMLYSVLMKPVTLPPGRAKPSTNQRRPDRRPPGTQSARCGLPAVTVLQSRRHGPG